MPTVVFTRSLNDSGGAVALALEQERERWGDCTFALSVVSASPIVWFSLVEDYRCSK